MNMDKDTAFLLQAITMGVVITFGYDWLRIFRRVINHKRIAVSLEDLVFWMVCAVTVFWWMYRASNGSMRWFAVAGALFGMYLYKKLVSNLLVTYVSKILKYILQLLGKVLYQLFRPLRAAGRSMGRVQTKARSRRRKILGNLKMWLKSKGKALKIRIVKQ